MEDITNPNPMSSKKKRLVLYLFIGALVAITVLLGVNSILQEESAKKPGGGLIQKQYVGAMNRFQQTYYWNHGRFASSLEELGLPAHMTEEARAETEDYILLTVNFRQAAFNYVIPKEGNRRSRIGGVFVTKIPQTNELSTLSIVCQASLPGVEAIAPPINAQTCGSGTEKVE